MVITVDGGFELLAVGTDQVLIKDAERRAILVCQLHGVHAANGEVAGFIGAQIFGYIHCLLLSILRGLRYPSFAPEGSSSGSHTSRMIFRISSAPAPVWEEKGIMVISSP